jgi:hypothetical protein
MATPLLPDEERDGIMSDLQAIDRFCPGSVFTPFKEEDRCLCGLPRAAHTWAHDGRGGFVKVRKGS